MSWFYDSKLGHTTHVEADLITKARGHKPRSPIPIGLRDVLTILAFCAPLGLVLLYIAFRVVTKG